jgi:ribosomal protein S27AE
MTERALEVGDVGTYYATEIVQLATLSCPNCGASITSLHEFIAEGECRNCHEEITFKAEW